MRALSLIAVLFFSFQIQAMKCHSDQIFRENPSVSNFLENNNDMKNYKCELMDDENELMLVGCVDYDSNKAVFPLYLDKKILKDNYGLSPAEAKDDAGTMKEALQESYSRKCFDTPEEADHYFDVEQLSTKEMNGSEFDKSRLAVLLAQLETINFNAKAKQEDVIGDYLKQTQTFPGTANELQAITIDDLIRNDGRIPEDSDRSGVSRK